MVLWVKKAAALPQALLNLPPNSSWSMHSDEVHKWLNDDVMKP